MINTAVNSCIDEANEHEQTEQMGKILRQTASEKPFLRVTFHIFCRWSGLLACHYANGMLVNNSEGHQKSDFYVTRM